MAPTETEEPETTTEELVTVPPMTEEETTRVDAETETPYATTTPSAPDTGDHSNIAPYAVTLCVALLGSVTLLVRRKKVEE